MSVVSRQVKNKKNADGVATGKSGVVYDVSIRYKTGEVHTAAASGRWCGAERPLCGLSNSRH